MAEPTVFPEKDCFAHPPPPKALAQRLDAVRRFVEFNINQGKRVVLITASPPHQKTREVVRGIGSNHGDKAVRGNSGTSERGARAGRDSFERSRWGSLSERTRERVNGAAPRNYDGHHTIPSMAGKHPS